MILHFTPLGWSCWYSIPVKDGVLLKRGLQALCANVCFLAVLQSQFTNIGSLRFVISLLKQVTSEDFGSKS
jgi:hypothetical protein